MSKKRIIAEQATTDIFNDDWLVKDSVTQGTTKIQPSVFKAWINDGMATEEDIETIVENIADTYSTSESYAEGDLCIHEYALFKCIGATTGTWDSTKWEATTIAEIISTIDLSAEAISYDNTSSGLEAENVQEAIDETITKLSAVGSASGDIATFTDGSALPMPSLKVAIEPQQEGSGEPSPTNVRPIVGWDEVNVSVSPLNIAPLYNGQIYGDGTWVGNNARLTNVQTAQSNTYFLKAGTYTLNYDKLNPNAPDLKQCSALTKDDNYTIIDNFANAWNSVPFTFTLAQDGYLYFTIRRNADTNINPSDYRAKILGQTYTIDLDGTRYGGTLDVVSGVLTITHEYVDMGTLTWSVISAQNGVFGATVNGLKTYSYGDTPDMLCSAYKVAPSSYNDPYISANGIIWTYVGVSALRIKDTAYTDATAFKTAMNGVQLVYELATPQTIQLTPTQVKSLLGVNNVWADTGNILEAKYVRDLTTTINYILEQLNS